MGILENYSKRPSKVCFLNLIDINTVIPDFAILNIIESVNQVCNRSLAGTRRSDKGNLLTGSCGYLNIMKNYLVIGISEVYIIKFHITLKLYICGCIVGFMIMLPSPASCMVRSLDELAVFFLGVNKGNISLIRFRLLVH